MIDLVQQLGFLPLLVSGISGYSAEEMADEECRYVVFPDGKAKQWPLYDLKDKQVMVLDEHDIHTAKESEVKIVDWERTYFLTDYYMP